VVFLLLCVHSSSSRRLTTARREKAKDRARAFFQFTSRELEDVPTLFLKEAVSKTTYTCDSQKIQYFDKGKTLLTVKGTDLSSLTWAKVVTAINNELSGSQIATGNDLSIRRIKIYQRDFIFPIKHEFIQMCAYDSTGSGAFQYFFIAHRGTVLHKLGSKTRVDFVYVGKEAFDDCSSASTLWTEKRSSFCSGTACLLEETTTNNNNPVPVGAVAIQMYSETMKTFLFGMINYVDKYKGYDLQSINCQHFATGFYNAFSGSPTKKKVNTWLQSFGDVKPNLVACLMNQCD